MLKISCAAIRFFRLSLRQEFGSTDGLSSRTLAGDLRHSARNARLRKPHRFHGFPRYEDSAADATGSFAKVAEFRQTSRVERLQRCARC
jgi:hypothetical protein